MGLIDNIKEKAKQNLEKFQIHDNLKNSIAFELDVSPVKLMRYLFLYCKKQSKIKTVKY